ncbi:MAG: acyl-CoA thioesterase [Candidatus Limnocylindrales bacterium]
MMTRPYPPRGPFHYRRPIEVRFGDTDAMGHVNNAVYLTYFEMARAGYYRAATGSTFGIGAESNERSFILAEARVTYVSPIRFGEPLVCECRVAWAGCSSFGMEFRLLAEDSPFGRARLAAHGATVQVMYDYATGRVQPLPAELRARVEAYEGRPITSREAAEAADEGPAR